MRTWAWLTLCFDPSFHTTWDMWRNNFIIRIYDIYWHYTTYNCIRKCSPCPNKPCSKAAYSLGWEISLVDHLIAETGTVQYKPVVQMFAMDFALDQRRKRIIYTVWRSELLYEAMSNASMHFSTSLCKTTCCTYTKFLKRKMWWPHTVAHYTTCLQEEWDKMTSEKHYHWKLWCQNVLWEGKATLQWKMLYVFNSFLFA